MREAFDSLETQVHPLERLGPYDPRANKEQWQEREEKPAAVEKRSELAVNSVENGVRCQFELEERSSKEKAPDSIEQLEEDLAVDSRCLVDEEGMP